MDGLLKTSPVLTLLSTLKVCWIALWCSSFQRGLHIVLFLLANIQQLQNLPKLAEITLKRLYKAFSSENVLTAESSFNGAALTTRFLCVLICFLVIVLLQLSNVYIKSERLEDGLKFLKEALTLAKSGSFDPGFRLAYCQSCKLQRFALIC